MTGIMFYHLVYNGGWCCETRVFSQYWKEKKLVWETFLAERAATQTVVIFIVGPAFHS